MAWQKPEDWAAEQEQQRKDEALQNMRERASFLLSKVNITLMEILELYELFDEGATNIHPDTLRAKLEIKVDEYHDASTIAEYEEKRLRFLAAQLTEAARKQKKKQVRIEELLLWAMKTSQNDRLPGFLWTASRRKSTATEMLEEATEELKGEFPDLIKTAFSWDKNAVKKELKAGSARLLGVAELKTNEHVHFDPFIKEK